MLVHHTSLVLSDPTVLRHPVVHAKGLLLCVTVQARRCSRSVGEVLHYDTRFDRVYWFDSALQVCQFRQIN